MVAKYIRNRIFIAMRNKSTKLHLTEAIHIITLILDRFAVRFLKKNRSRLNLVTVCIPPPHFDFVFGFGGQVLNDNVRHEVPVGIAILRGGGEIEKLMKYKTKIKSTLGGVIRNL